LKTKRTRISVHNSVQPWRFSIERMCI
jgi:hypothetical protein